MITRNKMGTEVMSSLKVIQEDISKMHISLQSLHTDIADIKSELSTIKELKSSLEFTQESLSEVVNNVSDIKSEVDIHAAKIDRLEIECQKNQKENDYLKEKLLHSDTHSRKENLIFVGISGNNQESTINKIRELWKNKLEITDAETIQVQRCHRFGPQIANRPRDIIVRFAFFPDREKIWKNRGKLKGTNIIMKEDFPQEIEQRRSQLYPIFKMAREKNFRPKLAADKLFINGAKYTVENLQNLPEELNPRQIAERITDKAVLFYGSKSCLSNFHKVDIMIDGKLFNSCEQFLQYRKATCTGNHDIASQILHAVEPKDQYRLGKKLTGDENKWNVQIAKEVLEKAIKCKFEQNDELRKQLLNSGDKIIAECNPHEHYWSNGLRLDNMEADDSTKWTGQNLTGSILCAVRDSFK